MHDPDVGSHSADPIKFGFKRGAYFESGRGAGPLTISGLVENISRLRCSINGTQKRTSNDTAMRIAMATVVALLILNFVDEHFYDARFTQAATTMLSQIARSFS